VYTSLEQQHFLIVRSHLLREGIMLFPRYSNRAGLREVHVVNGVHQILCGDALTSEEAAVKALDGVLAALDTVKLDVNLSISGAGSNTDVHYLPVVVVALFFDIFFELFVPSGLLSTSAWCQFET
jgi:hypothetical protein